MNGISVLIKETPESSLAPCTMWGYSEHTAIYEPGGGFSPDTESVSLYFPRGWMSQASGATACGTFPPNALYREVHNS